jgi:hypothetical protein
VRDNIIYGDLTATEERRRNQARAARTVIHHGAARRL